MDSLRNGRISCFSNFVPELQIILLNPVRAAFIQGSQGLKL